MNSKNPNYIITHQKLLSKNEVTSLRAVCDRHFSLIHDRRNALMITLALDCGLRASEVLGLTVGALDVENSSVFIESKKGSNARELPIRTALTKELKKFALQHYGKDQWHQLDKAAKIFDFTYTRLYQIWQYYTPNKDKTFHSLRHTFAVGFYLKNKDLKALQLALGHRNIQNTMVYMDFVYTQIYMRKMMV